MIARENNEHKEIKFTLDGIVTWTIIFDKIFILIIQLYSFLIS
jgi:hypothetical protein